MENLADVDLTDLNDPLTSNSSFRLLSDLELAVIVTKELGYLISEWENRQNSGRFPGLGIKSLKDRVRNVDCLAVHTKCDMWSILHMAHPLIFQPNVDQFRENEREVFLALSREVIPSIRVQLHNLNGCVSEVVFPVSRRSGEFKSKSYPDYDGLGDLELVMVSCKELDFILTEQFSKHKHNDLADFGDNIRHAVDIDDDARHKLSWLNNQRDVFLTNRDVNNFSDEQARRIFINVCKDVRDILNPDVKRTHSNSSSDPGNYTSEMDKRLLITRFLEGGNNSNRLKMIFIVFCVILFVLVLSVLIYELTKSK